MNWQVDEHVESMSNLLLSTISCVMLVPQSGWNGGVLHLI